MPSPRTRASALVGLLLAATTTLAPSPALAEGTTTDTPTPTGTTGSIVRGADGIVLEGRPVTGGDATDSTPLQFGDSTDTLAGDDAALNYQVTRTEENSTLRIAVVGASGSEGGDIAVEAHPNTTSASCPSSSASSYGDPGLLSTEIVLTPDGDCGGLEPYRIEVTGSAPERGLPFVIRVTQEPGVAAYGPQGTTLTTMAQPPAAGDPRGTVKGGLRFSNAPVIERGRWTSELVPGETRLYRIPLRYGQSAQVGVAFDPLSETQTTDLGTSYLNAQIQLLDPMLGAINEPDDAVLEAQIGEGPTFTGIGSVNRGAAQVSSSGSTQLAGNYYLTVTADGVSGESVSLPFTIDLDVLGEPDAGPSWTGVDSWRVSEQVTPVAGGDPTEPGASDSAATGASGASVTAIASGSAGLVLIMVGVTLLMRQRQRRRG